MKILVDKLPKEPDDCCFAKIILTPQLWECVMPTVRDLGERCELAFGGTCPYLKEIVTRKVGEP